MRTNSGSDTRQQAYELGKHESEEVIQRLRGQLQNCVSLLGRAKRRSGGSSEQSVYQAGIDSANKALYES